MWASQFQPKPLNPHLIVMHVLTIIKDILILANDFLSLPILNTLINMLDGLINPTQTPFF